MTGPTADGGHSAADTSLRHLLGRLAVLEARVRAAIERRRKADPSPEDRFRGLYLSEADVDRVLRRPERAEPASDALLAGVEVAAGASRLRRLAADFAVDDVDLDLLITALAPDLDPRFEKLFGYLHDDVSRRRASTGLALQLAGRSPMDESARGRFAAGSPLVSGGLLLVEEPERPFLTRSLRVPDRVAAHLLGGSSVDPVLLAALRTCVPLDCPEADRIRRALAADVRTVYCRQPPGDWAVAVAAAVAPTALVLDLATLAAADATRMLRAGIREARLTGRMLVAGPIDGCEPSTVRAVADGAVRAVLHGHQQWDPVWSDGGVLVLDLQALARRQVPIEPTLDTATAGRPPALAAFRLSPDQVRRAVVAAHGLAAADGVTATDEHLRAGARMQNASGLGRLARRVEPVARWSDLVLPPVPLSQLQHLTDRMRWRETVMSGWRMRRAGGRGEGITALFAGEPGTGKTMAAEVIASELGLDLYVIDLSTVVDKYIGETEKNLERVFSGAEGVNGVLFFDEADALFGKRSEVSDARDRYANLEVSYLLQRMESFDGLAVLATNLRANLDSGFARRLSQIVEFQRPDVEQRKALWRKAFAAVPLGADVDLEFCAEAFELAGGRHPQHRPDRRLSRRRGRRHRRHALADQGGPDRVPQARPAVRGGGVRPLLPADRRDQLTPARPKRWARQPLRAQPGDGGQYVRRLHVVDDGLDQRAHRLVGLVDGHLDVQPGWSLPAGQLAAGATAPGDRTRVGDDRVAPGAGAQRRADSAKRAPVQQGDPQITEVVADPIDRPATIDRQRDPGRLPAQAVVGGVARVEVGVEVVQRADHRSEHSVEGVQQVGDQRPGPERRRHSIGQRNRWTGQFVRGPARHQLLRRSVCTMCSTLKTRWVAARSIRSTGSECEPSSGLARNSWTSST